MMTDHQAGVTAFRSEHVMCLKTLAERNPQRWLISPGAPARSCPQTRTEWASGEPQLAVPEAPEITGSLSSMLAERMDDDRCQKSHCARAI